MRVEYIKNNLDENNKAALNSWKIIEFDSMKIVIQLYFKNQIDVSSGTIKD